MQNIVYILVTNFLTGLENTFLVCSGDQLENIDDLPKDEKPSTR
jgi:hypothetical protein